MSKNEIIQELFLSKEFNECIGKMEPDHLQDDLKMEVMLALLEKPDEFISELYEKSGLRFYAVRIILNMIQSKTSPFYKKYRSIGSEYSDRKLSMIVETATNELSGRESHFLDKKIDKKSKWFQIYKGKKSAEEEYNLKANCIGWSEGLWDKTINDATDK